MITGCGPSSKTSEPATTPVRPEAKLAAQKARQYRLEWNRTTLVSDYEHHGSRNAKWDDVAKQALDTFALVRAGSPEEWNTLVPKMTNEVATAVINGCDDPMIKYLHARLIMPYQNHDSQQHAAAFRDAAEALDQSQRAPIRKYYAAMRAAEFGDLGTATSVPEVHRWREEAKRFLTEVVNDKATPPGEVYDAWEAFFQQVPTKSKEHFELFLALEPTLLKNWPAEPSVYLLGMVLC